MRGSVLVRDGERWLRFARPRRELTCRSPHELPDLLRAADHELAAGAWIAGCVGYEAARAYGLRTREPAPPAPPLVWLGVYPAPEPAAPPPPRLTPGPPLDWRPGLDAAAYRRAFERIQTHLALGDSYQVNLTFPLDAPLAEEPERLFARLVSAQPARYAAFVDLGRFAIASVSPELFFAREGERLTARPMKGTAARGAGAEADARAAAALLASAKERAENVMIVDMLRNDLGRIARVGSVAVPSLFDVERYPTLLQMTSTVTARSPAPLSAVFAALFPCASVTGAPKASSMGLIAELEAEPRGVYTGAIGWAGPQRACFSVAIRTATADRERGRVRYPVGSGVVADSTAEAEYAECLLKARVLSEPPFALIATLGWSPHAGFRRLAGQLERLAASADFFGITCDGAAVHDALQAAVHGRDQPARVRLLLGSGGEPGVECAPLLPLRPPLQVGVASRPVDRGSPWLRHKTTRRELYQAAAAERPDCDDVLLWNDAGELTEATRFNLAVQRGGGLVTPALESGLLAGVERAALLAEGRLREGVVRVDALRPGDRLWLFNAVHGTCGAVRVA